MRSRIYPVIILFLLCAHFQDSRAFGQDGSGRKHSDPLTEKAAVALALGRSRELESLDTEIRIADFRLQSSGAIENPELRLRDLSSRYLTEEIDEIQVGLRWRPPELGESAMKKQEARVGLWRRKVEARRFRVRLAADVRRAFARVLLCDRLAELEQRKTDLESERTAFVEGLANLGKRSVIDLTRVRLDHTGSKSRLTRAVHRKGEARAAFSRLTGVPEATVLAVEDPRAMSRDINGLLEEILDGRSEIELARQRSRLLEKEQRYASRLNIPWPTFIEVSYHTIRDREDWEELHLGVTLPLFNWNNGSRKAAGLAVENGEMESALVREEIETDIRAAYAEYVGRLEEWKRYRQDIDPLILEAAKVVTGAKKEGTLPFDTILEMEMAVIETEVELNEKVYDLACALAELYVALGIESPEDLPTGGGN